MQTALFLDWLLNRRAARVFASDRLAFRWLRRDDIPSLCARFTSACVADMTTAGNDPRDPTALEHSSAHRFVVQRDGDIVGLISLDPSDRSFGIWIAPEHRRRGYGSEAVRALLAHPRYGRTVHRAGCFADNVACRKIIEDNGFVEKMRQVIESPFCPAPRIAVYFHRSRSARRAAQLSRERAARSSTVD